MLYGLRTSMVGDHEFSNQVAIPSVKVYHYDHAEADASFQVDIPVPAGTMIMSMSHVVEEAFAGGTPSVQVGDGSTPELFIASSAITEGTLNNMAYSNVRKWFPTAGMIRVTLVTGLTAGKGALHVESYNVLGNWRQPDL